MRSGVREWCAGKWINANSNSTPNGNNNSTTAAQPLHYHPDRYCIADAYDPDFSDLESDCLDYYGLDGLNYDAMARQWLYYPGMDVGGGALSVEAQTYVYEFAIVFSSKLLALLVLGMTPVDLRATCGGKPVTLVLAIRMVLFSKWIVASVATTV